MCYVVFQCNLLYCVALLSAAGQDLYCFDLIHSHLHNLLYCVAFLCAAGHYMIFLCIERSSFPSVVIEEEERGAHLQNYNASSNL